MTYEPLHHKYRPQTFSDLVGQGAIATTLSNALTSERIAPAYLFTGPRGTGKTSSARILAKSLNCLSSDRPTPIPCGQCDVCRSIANGSALDVIEIDAASNTGVDNIREIIERSQFAPVQCRYKVYVIDECLTGDSLVLTETGLTRIDNPEIRGKRVLSYNEITGEWEYKKVDRWIDRGIKETLIVTTTNRTIRCTGNHPIRTEKGWIQAKNLPIGTKILSPAVTPRKLSPTRDRVAVESIITSRWEPSRQTDGSPIYNPTPSPRWLTNFEEVIAIEIGDAENVYDIEVEDNHNFVANGLLVHNCHMLSTAAFNALLKTLEEPPDRVIFVLATTDPQRVLPTIISRCQRFDYRRIPLDAMVGHLQKIAHLESIDIDTEAITLVAQIANGGLRDAESLLDQLSLLAGTVTADRVWEFVGAVPERDLLALLKAIRSDIPDQVIEQCRHLMNRGKEPLIVLQNLAGFYLNLLLAKTAPSRSEMVAVTAPTWQELCTEARAWQLDEILRGQQALKDSESQLRNTTQPRLWLEITLLGLLPSARVTPTVTVTQSPVRSNPTPVSSPSPAAPVNPPAPPPVRETPPRAIVPHETNEKTPTPSAGDSGDIWERILEILEPRLTRDLLRQKGFLLSVEESGARVGIASEQLLKMARPNLANIEAAFEAVFQRPIKVQLQVGKAIDPGTGEQVQKAQEVSQKAQEATRDAAGQASAVGIGLNPIDPGTGERVQKVREAIRDAAGQASAVGIGLNPIDPGTGEQVQKAREAIRDAAGQASEVVREVTTSGAPAIANLVTNEPVNAIREAASSLTEEIADSELLKAAQSFAKFFEGEIVTMGQNAGETGPKEVKAEKTAANTPIVRGRPDVSEIMENLEDDEDIPF